MTRRKIVLASVLKPVDETRMFEKFALSMGQTNKYEINIIGFVGKKSSTPAHIHFHAVFSFGRWSWKRVLTGITFFRKLREIRPDLVIVHTHELLIPGVIYKILFGGGLIYDVQENYLKNLLFTPAFPIFMRPLLATWVRLKEHVTRPWIDTYLLAEKCYANELSFTRHKRIILENRIPKPHPLPPYSRQWKGPELNLLFTGTLAPTTGVLEAIHWAVTLQKVCPNTRLTIAGFVAQNTWLSTLQNAISSYPWIRLVGGSEHVPHPRIVEEIQRANFGLISYPPHPATAGKMPTKLFEYLGYHLPILLRPHPDWESYCDPKLAALVVDFSREGGPELIQRMRETVFYTPNSSQEIFWEDIASNLIDEVDKLLINKYL
jgi:hypothetical protein